MFSQETALIDGVELPEVIARYTNLSARNTLSVKNLFSLEMLAKFGFGKEFKEADEIYKKIFDVCQEIYKGRLKSGSKGGLNMLDLMIAHKKNEGGEWTMEEIVGFFILLQFAGADTSRTISQSLIYYLSDKPDL
jgi:cytochrome P450